MKTTQIHSNSLNIFYKFSAFTLAEVLITLGIIGIIAAITIPTLVSNFQDKALKTAWRREYSILTLAVKSIIDDNGGDISGLCTTSDCFAGILANKVNTVQKCAQGNTLGNCWHLNNVAKALGGFQDCISRYGWIGAGLMLADGSFINVRYTAGDICNGSLNGSPTIDCGHLFIDVNGFKGPNIFGKDIFLLEITRNNIYAGGTPTYSSLENYAGVAGCNPADTGSPLEGLGCSAWFLHSDNYYPH